mmetsp:Transcript_16229/g.42004  ORF Transcript_16229/g.42004 Transcript_16229/m.42004 type:complete len:326 (+) Transcript_16229:182-1159(+)
MMSAAPRASAGVTLLSPNTAPLQAPRGSEECSERGPAPHSTCSTAAPGSPPSGGTVGPSARCVHGEADRAAERATGESSVQAARQGAAGRALAGVGAGADGGTGLGEAAAAAAAVSLRLCSAGRGVCGSSCGGTSRRVALSVAAGGVDGGSGSSLSPASLVPPPSPSASNLLDSGVGVHATPGESDVLAREAVALGVRVLLLPEVCALLCRAGALSLSAPLRATGDVPRAAPAPACEAPRSPPSSSSAATDTWPMARATARGVCPRASCASTGARALSSAAVAATCPPRAHRCRAVSPFRCVRAPRVPLAPSAVLSNRTVSAWLL